MGRVTGKIALVTGAARGQGRSHAVRLAKEGADIIAMDICAPVEGITYEASTPADLRRTAALVREQGARVVTAEVDTRERHALSEAVDGAVEEMGGLDVVVANAGVVAFERWNEFSQQQWDAVVGVNVMGTANTMVVGAKHLVARGGGSMIATSSVAGLTGTPYVLPYVASKHAVVGMTRALSNELADENVRVNAILPTGVARTVMWEATLTPEVTQLVASNERLAPAFANALQVAAIQPSDVSNAVLYLASDEARFVTGITLPVDAGNINL